MLFFGNKYVKGITQFIPDNHRFGARDFIDYHRERMGLTREEYMAFYRRPVDYRLAESTINEKAEGDRGPIDDEKVEKALKTKSEETGVPLPMLRVIMRRGMAAWKTGHRPGATEHQWGYARVNSFLTKQPGTWGDVDSDIAKEVRDGGHDKNLKKA